MQLNKFTDFALRLLMHLAQNPHQTTTIAQAAEILEVSENHLVKITHFLSKQGWIVGTRGRGGGISIKAETFDLRLGDMVRILENDEKLVNCFEPMCTLRINCQLKGILDRSLNEFYQSLNQYQLKDALKSLQVTPKLHTINAIPLVNV